jgi:hypothetical protein
MSANSNSFFAAMFAKADAQGDQTDVATGTTTAVLPGVSIGYAFAIAVAQDTAPDTPHTEATTGGVVNDGFLMSSNTSHMSVDFPHGPTPVSLDVSVTFVSSHGGRGDFLSDTSLHSPSLHGLF